MPCDNGCGFTEEQVNRLMEMEDARDDAMLKRSFHESEEVRKSRGIGFCEYCSKKFDTEWKLFETVSSFECPQCKRLTCKECRVYTDPQYRCYYCMDVTEI